MHLAGKVALVTGAGSGIGAAAARLLADEGAHVAALGRTRDKLDDVVAEIKAKGGEALALAADTSHPEEIARAVRQTVERFGRLDIVFANAGVNSVCLARRRHLPPDSWRCRGCCEPSGRSRQPAT